MKRLLLFLFISFIVISANATNKFWVGGSSGTWNSTASWSLTSGGTSGAAVPTGTDLVIFDGNTTTSTTYTSTTVDVTGATITAGTLQVNAGVTLNFSGTAASINFSGVTNALSILGYFNDGGNTVFAGGAIAWSFSLSTSAASPGSFPSNVCVLQFAVSSSNKSILAGVKIGQLCNASAFQPTVTQTSWVTAVDTVACQVQVTSLSSIASAPASGTSITFGPLTGYYPVSGTYANGSSNVSYTVSGTNSIVAGSSLVGTGLSAQAGTIASANPTNSGTTYTVNVYPYANAANGTNLIYFNGAKLTGSGKLVLLGGTYSSPRNIGGNNFYYPSLKNVYIGDGTTPSFAQFSGGGFRITGIFDVSSSGWFIGSAQTAQIHDPVNNISPTVVLEANAKITVYNKSNGLAQVQTNTFGSNPCFSFPPSVTLSSQVICDPTSTVIDSVTGSTQNTIVSAPITYGNLGIWNANTSTGAVSFTSNQATTIKGTLTVFTSSGGGVSLGSGTLVMSSGSQLVVSSGATFNFNARPVTLQSDATGSATIQNLAGSISGASNVTVQRYIGSSNQWRMIGFPLSGTVSETTLAGFYSGNYNAYTYNEAADDGTNYGNSGSVNAGWTSFASGTSSAQNGILLIGGSTSTIGVTGTLNTGTQSIPLTKNKNGWNFIANPFPSNINWTSIQTNNSSLVNNAIYRYNPGSTNYGSYVSGTSTNGQNNIIENGAGFFVQATAAGNLSIAESDKSTSATAASLMGLRDIRGTISNTGVEITPSINNISTIKLSLAKQGDLYTDEVALLWGGFADVTDKFDGKYDAYDLGRATGPDLSVIGNDKTQYSIFHGSELKNSSDENRTVQLGIKNMTEGTYQIGIQLQSPIANGNKAYLYDSYTGTYTLIDDNTSNYSFITTADPKSQSSTRFSVVMNAKQVATIINDNSTLPVILLNNPSTGNNFTLYSKNNYNQLQWQVIDGGGRVMQTGQINSVLKGSTHQINAGNTATGHYFIKLSGDGNALPVLKAVKN